MSEASQAAELIAVARTLYDGDAAAGVVLDEFERRLREPLRVAIAGIVKAGKSTMLNALIGERIAPTDAGECTRVVTWYRRASSPSITLHLADGDRRRLPARREGGRLILDLDGVPAEEVDRIDVGWPTRKLTNLVLIDTPGIASLSRDVSARSTRFLVPDEAPSAADAVVYLLRHLHASDLRFLEAFRDTAAPAAQTVNALAVLSRADEVGSGRIDSMLSARKVARRYESDGELAALALAVVPVAGLLAEGARTLREGEYAAFRALAGLDRAEREALLVSADRFVRSGEPAGLDPAARHDLLGRFGMFGVRLATTLIRGGVADSSELAERLVEHSGLEQVQEFVRRHFAPRAGVLKARAVAQGLTALLRERPRVGADPLRAGIERIETGSHALRELSLLSAARVGALAVPAGAGPEAVRLSGGDGAAVTTRLGLARGADAATVAGAIRSALARWRVMGQSPLADRATVETCRVVTRSLEEMASHLAGGAAADIVLPGGPGDAAAGRAGQQRSEREDRLGDEQLA